MLWSFIKVSALLMVAAIPLWTIRLHLSSEHTRIQVRDLSVVLHNNLNENDGYKNNTAETTTQIDESCLKWTGAARVPPTKLPTGIVVTLLMGKDAMGVACHSLRNQIINFLDPQGIDLILLVDRPLTTQAIVQCLNLTQTIQQQQHDARIWKNEDGSKLLTKQYRFRNTRTKVIVGQTNLYNTLHLDPNWSPKDLPRNCQFSMDYIQGTRWYSNEMLHLAILKEQYDYWLKIDLDVWFLKPWNHFHLLSDMQLKGSLFGHTAMYDRGGFTCAGGIQDAVKDYRQTHHGNRPMCSSNIPEVNRNSDLYYTNFIIGQVDFWTQPRVQHFGRYLSNTANGFLTERWTDQIFWHYAMALFVGPDFTEAVADYTDVRCNVNPHCWQALVPEVGYRQCDGYFMHTKGFPQYLMILDHKEGIIPKALQLSSPYQSYYQYGKC